MFRPVDIISSHYNARMKLYPDGEGGLRPVELLALSKSSFNPDGWEPVRGESGFSGLAEPVTLPDEAAEAAEQRPADDRRSKRRSRAAVWDIINCNADLDAFVTLTLSPRSVDRYDYRQIVALLRGWLSNRVQRQALKYVLVPEHHKDGAVHFHGLMNSGALALTPTGLYNDEWNRPVYRLGDYPHGRTQAVLIGDDRERSARYCCKYISKSDERCGGRRYLHGGALALPEYRYFNVDYAALKPDVAGEYPGGGYKLVRMS